LKKSFLLGFLVLALAACVNRPGEAPTVQLKSPADGVQVALGDRVLVEAVAQDDQGVVKAELWVDGRLYEVNRAPESQGQPSLDVIQIWDPSTTGTHTLSIRAYDDDGLFSTPVSVQVQVVTPVPVPTFEPTATPTSALDPSCVISAHFVEDVNVPDDSLYNSGVRFTKTWRLQNDGSCTWEPGTQWVFINGDLMGAESPVSVELAEPDRIVDISVDFVAPPAPGTYTSYWRLRRPNGEFFGDQAYVRIKVP
jgi:hypothetical protein